MESSNRHIHLNPNLHFWGFYRSVAYRKPLISRENRVKRVWWGNQVRVWTPNQHWSKICLSDESQYYLRYNYGRMRVWCQPDEALLSENGSLVNHRASCSEMVWRHIIYHVADELVIIDGKMDHADYIASLEWKLSSMTVTPEHSWCCKYAICISTRQCTCV